MSLIPESAKRDLAESDARKAKARETATADGFRRSFTSQFAREIEMIRLGAVVKETVADHLRSQGLPVLDAADETRPYSLELPSGKPIPTAAQSRRKLAWSRFTRFLRAAIAAFPRAFNGLVRDIKNAWKGW